VRAVSPVCAAMTSQPSAITSAPTPAAKREQCGEVTILAEQHVIPPLGGRKLAARGSANELSDDDVDTWLEAARPAHTRPCQRPHTRRIANSHAGYPGMLGPTDHAQISDAYGR
jgi:hypothetical protein